MNKSTFFTGQPIFSQLLRFIPKDSIVSLSARVLLSRPYAQQTSREFEAST